jgi:hypothetical protein
MRRFIDPYTLDPRILEMILRPHEQLKNFWLYVPHKNQRQKRRDARRAGRKLPR